MPEPSSSELRLSPELEILIRGRIEELEREQYERRKLELEVLARKRIDEVEKEQFERRNLEEDVRHKRQLRAITICGIGATAIVSILSASMVILVRGAAQETSKTVGDLCMTGHLINM